MDKCINKLLNLVGPFPIDVVRQKDYLEISVNFNGTFDIYTTTSSGKEICKTVRQVLKKPSITFKSLEEIHPECVR